MERKRIGVPQYCNITPISALETPDQVTLEAVRPILVRGVWVDGGVGARVVSMSQNGVETDGASVLEAGLEFMLKGSTKEAL